MPDIQQIKVGGSLYTLRDPSAVQLEASETQTVKSSIVFEGPIAFESTASTPVTFSNGISVTGSGGVTSSYISSSDDIVLTPAAGKTVYIENAASNSKVKIATETDLHITATDITIE